MADAHRGMDGFGLHAGSVLAGAGPPHPCSYLTGPACAPRRGSGRLGACTMSPSALVGRAREREAIAAALRAYRGRGRGRGRRGRAGDRQVAAARPPGGVCGGGSVHGARRARVGVRDRSAVRAVDRRPGRPYAGRASSSPRTGDRHHTHRALRHMLERLATPRGLVVWMDDVQWADPASVEALAALMRRPPAAPRAVRARRARGPSARRAGGCARRRRARSPAHGAARSRR